MVFRGRRDRRAARAVWNAMQAEIQGKESQIDHLLGEITAVNRLLESMREELNELQSTEQD